LEEKKNGSNPKMGYDNGFDFQLAAIKSFLFQKKECLKKIIWLQL
jgi:hypothetical protein